jgi:hypothetical protein
VEAGPTLRPSLSWDHKEGIEAIALGLVEVVGTVVAHQEEDHHRINGIRDQGVEEDLPIRIGVAHLVVPQVPHNTKVEDMEALRPSINKVDGTRDPLDLLDHLVEVIMEEEEAILVALTEDLLTGVLLASIMVAAVALEVVVVCQGDLAQSHLHQGECRLQASMVVHLEEVEEAGEEGHQVDLVVVFLVASWVLHLHHLHQAKL